MIDLIKAKIKKALSNFQIFLSGLLSTGKEIALFTFFITSSPASLLYNFFQALYSFIVVAFYARSYATFKLFKSFLCHKKNAYQLARAICRYREHFGENEGSPLQNQILDFILTPQNTQPYESVELAAHFIYHQVHNKLTNHSKRPFFELASKACCWGVSEPYHQAVDLLLINRRYSYQRGLHLLSLNPEEMLEYAQQIIAGRDTGTYNKREIIGSSLPAGQNPYNFRRLLSRINDDVTIEVAPKFEVNMNKILHFFHTHPQHLRWANDIAANALEGCVNQPLMGWLEICAWVHIAKQPTILKKLQAAKFLHALAHAKIIIANATLLVSQWYYPEYVCGMMQSVYYSLCSENAINEPWIGIGDGLWDQYRVTIEISPYFSFQREKILHGVKNMTIEDAIETVFMQSAGRGFWAQIAVNQEVQATFSAENDKEIEYLRKVILYLAGQGLPDILEEIREMGYQSQEFEAFLEQKSPGHANKTPEQKILEVQELNKELQMHVQHHEISLNQKALTWTKRQVEVAQESRSAASRNPGPRM